MGPAVSGLVVRPMRPDDLPFAFALAAGEGWNPGPSEGPCLYACDPEGFLIGEVEGTAAGCISAVRYGPGFGFVGLFIVAPPFRGRGYGFTLWNAAMTLLGDRCVGLDGVLEKEQSYQRSGFRTAYSDIRFSGGPGRPPVQATAPRPAPPAVGGAAESGARAARFDIRGADQAPRQALLAYDRACFPAARTTFVECWLGMPGGRALCALEGGEVRGYGMIRPCLSGYKFGPLFADDPDVAEALYLALCSAVPDDETVYLDVPEPNAAGVALAGAHGLREVFRTVRMYRGPEPDMALDKVFGVTTFELG